MLNSLTPPQRRQQGVVLAVALLMLLAMTMGGISLIRAVYTSSLAAGNIAFQQAATYSGDAGIEAGITWLERNNSGTSLHSNSLANGYAATRQDPVGKQSWHDFWKVLENAGQVTTAGAADAAGNSVAYTIQRLCSGTGAPTSGVGCVTAQAAAGTPGSGRGSGIIEIRFSGQVYYRITSRVTGPRSTVSYVQVVVAM